MDAVPLEEDIKRREPYFKSMTDILADSQVTSGLQGILHGAGLQSLHDLVGPLPTPAAASPPPGPTPLKAKAVVPPTPPRSPTFPSLALSLSAEHYPEALPVHVRVEPPAVPGPALHFPPSWPRPLSPAGPPAGPPAGAPIVVVGPHPIGLPSRAEPSPRPQLLSPPAPPPPAPNQASSSSSCPSRRESSGPPPCDPRPLTPPAGPQSTPTAPGGSPQKFGHFQVLSPKVDLTADGGYYVGIRPGRRNKGKDIRVISKKNRQKLQVCTTYTYDYDNSGAAPQDPEVMHFLRQSVAPGSSP
eukprot:EG_transcript_3270